MMLIAVEKGRERRERNGHQKRRKAGSNCAVVPDLTAQFGKQRWQHCIRNLTSVGSTEGGIAWIRYHRSRIRSR